MKSFCALCRKTQLVLALLMGLGAAPLQAAVHLVPVPQPAADYPFAAIQHAPVQRAQQREISREQAAALVKRRYGGKILAVSETTRKGRPAYRVKGLSDKSQVYVVYVDKQSGRIMR
ncbi:PepSY domain-containing protein [Microbulbifer yueqingensis]|uniref:Peptidase propeptide and YPEB domain-containing protein n=1 Tax=Microbulbifer yueqingensis TaxID=658219 RepID=A0A1G8V206_9GAMM|nr:PepSY domain-containing protein [Microbulbifer yueqingensis]SDJ59887.1 Peptidase propeptide and YPEB domain-containing protein [Microbulbifer yueqingensis]